jgi:hypothetical protein
MSSKDKSGRQDSKGWENPIVHLCSRVPPDREQKIYEKEAWAGV